MNGKKTTTIYVFEEILKFCKENHFSLSEWVNKEFFKQFLSIESKKIQIEKLHKEINEVKVRVDFLKTELTYKERRYICQVTPRLKEGKDLAYMHRWFNNEYNRKYSLDEFQALVEFYERAAIHRVKRAIREINNERN